MLFPVLNAFKDFRDQESPSLPCYLKHVLQVEPTQTSNLTDTCIRYAVDEVRGFSLRILFCNLFLVQLFVEYYPFLLKYQQKNVKWHLLKWKKNHEIW